MVFNGVSIMQLPKGIYILQSIVLDLVISTQCNLFKILVSCHVLIFPPFMPILHVELTSILGWLGLAILLGWPSGWSWNNYWSLYLMALTGPPGDSSPDWWCSPSVFTLCWPLSCACYSTMQVSQYPTPAAPNGKLNYISVRPIT